MRVCVTGTFVMVGFVLGDPRIAHAQPVTVDPGITGPAWSPYLVGALIGGLSMLTFYFSDNPLGASSSYAKLAGMVGKWVNRKHIERLAFFQKKVPRLDWSVMLLFGIVVGAFLAALWGNELTGRWLPPMWAERFGSAVWLRLVVAFSGGAMMAMGARIAGGCTSGHGISGALQLSVGSWIALVCFFAGGVAVAMPLFYL